jgi:hypothetical protein
MSIDQIAIMVFGPIVMFGLVGGATSRRGDD